MKYLKDIIKFKTEEPMANQIFNIILIMALFVSAFNIIGNQFIGYPQHVNLKWVFFIFLTLLVRRYYPNYDILKFIYTLIVLLFFVPLGWMNSGADNNNVIAYIFLIIICLAFVFQGWKQYLLVVLSILEYTAFIIIEFVRPDWLIQYSESVSFTDRLIQIPMALFSSYLILMYFSKSYTNNFNKYKETNRQLEIIAYTDSLTGVYNRAFIFEKLEDTIADKESRRPFVTMIIDIDDFKNVNDNYGHLVGDKVLSEFAEALNIEFGPYGYVSRYGGDEFILLIYADPKELEMILMKFKHRFSHLEVIDLCQVTLSGGYDYYKDQSLDDYLRTIDIALYKAKKTGKNQIIQADDFDEQSKLDA